MSEIKPYSVSTFKSSSSSINIEHLEKIKSTSHQVIAWKTDSIRHFERLDDFKSDYQKDEKWYLQIRIYNENEEFYFYKQNNQWKGRYRSDIEGNDTKAIDTDMKLRSPKNIGIKSEDGTKYLKTRNYISKTAVGYDDVRIVGIITK